LNETKDGDTFAMKNGVCRFIAFGEKLLGAGEFLEAGDNRKLGKMRQRGNFTSG